RSNKRRVPNIVEPEIHIIEEIVPMANHTIEELLQAPTEGYGEAIVISKILAESFEIKTNLLREAWDRFKEMLRACPHHGFSELTQIDTFYNGLNEQDQDSLNTATGDQPSVYAETGSYNQVSLPNRASHQIPPPGFAPVQNNPISFFQNQASTSGTLLSNIVPNLKGEMKAVTTHSGLAYEGPSILTNYPLEKVVEQDTEEITKIEHSNYQGNMEKYEVKNIVEQPTKRRTLIIESLQNFRVIHKKSSISLNNTSQISPVNEITPVLTTEEPEYSLSMGYEHLSTIPETESDEIIKSNVKKLVPIPNECEVTSDNESESDMPVCEDSSTFDVCEDHSEILYDSNNDITSNDDAFEDIEYVEASLLDSELVSLEEENVVYQKDKEFDLEDILQIQDVILRKKLLSINRLIVDIEFLNDNPILDCVLNSSSSFPIFEKSNNSLSILENSLPEFETFSDHTEETRSGSTITHADNSLPEYDLFCFEIEPDQERMTSIMFLTFLSAESEDTIFDPGDILFLEELLVDDSISFPKNESSNFDYHGDSSFPHPPPKPPDVDFFFDLEPNSGELISVVKNNNDELNEYNCFDP
nr:reverse transcriptase domain-containing protein [Tanacetum cinerariifolium]